MADSGADKTDPTRKALWSGLILGLLIHVAFFTVLHLDLPLFAPVEEFQTEISYLQSSENIDGVLLDRALIFDSSPLFMPTRWNAASSFEDIATLEQATEAFFPFDPIVSIEEIEVTGQDLLNTERPQAKRFMPMTSGFYLDHFGQTSSPAQSEGEVRGPQLLVQPIGSSEEAYFVDIPQNALEFLPNGLWEPMVWYLQLEYSSLVGTPQLAKGSSFIDWNEAVFALLQNPDVYRKFPNGYLRIQVLP